MAYVKIVTVQTSCLTKDNIISFFTQICPQGKFFPGNCVKLSLLFDDKTFEWF